jgi:hypothetical protein
MSVNGFKQGINSNSACNFTCRVPPQTISYRKECESIGDLLHIEGILVIGSSADMGSAAKGQLHGDSLLTNGLIMRIRAASLFMIPRLLCSAGITG